MDPAFFFLSFFSFSVFAWACLVWKGVKHWGMLGIGKTPCFSQGF